MPPNCFASTRLISLRIYHIITAGGGAPNVVPDFAEVSFARPPSATEVATKIYARLLKCAVVAPWPRRLGSKRFIWAAPWSCCPI